MGANDRTGVGSGSGEYETPGWIYSQFDHAYRFTYDPFASEGNAKVGLFSTLEGTFEQVASPDPEVWEKYRVRQLSGANGLEAPWTDQAVFCNPPYGRGLIEPCVRKMAEEAGRARLIFALLPAATDAEWFQRWVFPNADVTFLPFRIAFIHPPHPCKPDCSHAHGQPLTNPPGAYCTALFRRPWQSYREVNAS